MQTGFDVLGPITDVLLRVEHQIAGTGHVVLPLALAHVVVGAVRLVRVVGNVAVFLLTGNYVGCEGRKKRTL
jgi:hypothetical protein